jgi:glycosyltransferase involved in cell wall biosynthesis
VFDEFLENKDDLISARYYRNTENLKPYFNKRSGLEKISGKYLILLDHDDWFVDNSFIRTSVDHMERFSNCLVAIGNSKIENSSPRMFLHEFKTDPFEVDGKTYLKKYLFKKLHPAYSGVLMNFEQLTKLNFSNILISKHEANFYGITPDEAFVSIALLSEKGSVLISNKIVSVRGNPLNSYSKSDEWLKQWSLGVFFPFYHLFIHFLKKRAYSGAFSMFTTIIRSRSASFSQIYKLYKRCGFHFYILLLCINKVCKPVIRYTDHPYYTLSLLIPKSIKGILRKAKKL